MITTILRTVNKWLSSCIPHQWRTKRGRISCLMRRVCRSRGRGRTDRCSRPWGTRSPRRSWPGTWGVPLSELRSGSCSAASLGWIWLSSACQPPNSCTFYDSQSDTYLKDIWWIATKENKHIIGFLFMPLGSQIENSSLADINLR